MTKRRHLPCDAAGRWVLVHTPDGWVRALAEGGLDVVVWAERRPTGGWADGWCVLELVAGAERPVLVAWTLDPNRAADLVVEHAYLRCALAVGDLPAPRPAEDRASSVLVQ